MLYYIANLAEIHRMIFQLSFTPDYKYSACSLQRKQKVKEKIKSKI